MKDPPTFNNSPVGSELVSESQIEVCAAADLLCEY